MFLNKNDKSFVVYWLKAMHIVHEKLDIKTIQDGSAFMNKYS